MALVTIQRSPTPTDSPDFSETEIESEDCPCSSGPGGQRSSKATKSRSVSECYFTVKGAAIILPQNDTLASTSSSGSGGGGEIRRHLTAMLHLLRPQDTLKMAVRLESVIGSRSRYMAIVGTSGRQDTEEAVLLGIDTSPSATSLGLVVPIWANTRVALEGDGSISVRSDTGEQVESQHVFKPVSVQAMWSAFQRLHKEVEKANSGVFYSGGWSHDWVSNYTARLDSPESYRAEWYYQLPVEENMQDSLERFRERPAERAATEKLVRLKLKDIMQSVDLDEVTSKDIRGKLEENLDFELSEYKEFIDNEMLVILGQMDKPSKIFDFLYLGTEWNASNWEELRQNNVTHIVNVTKEVDNFFPGLFDYMKIPVTDEATSELLKHWDSTHRFIAKAQQKNNSVLVHCKKGISRSSSTVIAYAMKANGWSLEEALEFVKVKRNCITPNKGFMQQLRTYQGILDASRNRNSTLWNQQDAPYGSPSPEIIPESGSTPPKDLSAPQQQEPVTYSEKEEAPESGCSIVASFPSGNVLQAVPFAGPFLDPSRTPQSWPEADESIPRLEESIPKDFDSESLCHGRPPVKRHHRTIEERLKDPDDCSLKQVQAVLMRKRPYSGGLNASSSSGASCSESSSLASFSGEEGTEFLQFQRRHSKYSSGTSTGDSAVGELSSTGPTIFRVGSATNLDSLTETLSPSPDYRSHSSLPALQLQLKPHVQTIQVDSPPASQPSNQGRRRIWKGFHSRGAHKEEVSSVPNPSPSKSPPPPHTESKPKWYSGFLSPRSNSKSDEAVSGDQGSRRGRLKLLMTGTVQSRKEKLEKLSTDQNNESQPGIRNSGKSKSPSTDSTTKKSHKKPNNVSRIASALECARIGSRKPKTAGRDSADGVVRSLVGKFEIGSGGRSSGEKERNDPTVPLMCRRSSLPSHFGNPPQIMINVRNHVHWSSSTI